MKTRLFYHVGYHKTGTTSLQDFLERNRQALSPYLHYYGKDQMRDVQRAAHSYTKRPNFWRKKRFRRAVRRFLRDVPAGGTIVISNESLLGGMPGHLRWNGRMISEYGKQSITMAKILIQETGRCFGIRTEIGFLLTTRDMADWLPSVYGHLLRSIEMTDDYAEFHSKFRNYGGPEAEAEAMAAALKPVPVFIVPLEEFKDDPEGPAAALLDLVGVPDSQRERLLSAQHRNKGQANDVRAAFLGLNRSGLDKVMLKESKEALMDDEDE